MPPPTSTTSTTSTTFAFMRRIAASSTVSKFEHIGKSCGSMRVQIMQSTWWFTLLADARDEVVRHDLGQRLTAVSIATAALASQQRAAVHGGGLRRLAAQAGVSEDEQADADKEGSNWGWECAVGADRPCLPSRRRTVGRQARAARRGRASRASEERTAAVPVKQAECVRDLEGCQ